MGGYEALAVLINGHAKKKNVRKRERETGRETRRERERETGRERAWQEGCAVF